MRENVDTLFGYPGRAVLPIYDRLAAMRGSLRHVLARHEQGAVHMAEGYAKATGKVGVALVMQCSGRALGDGARVTDRNASLSLSHRAAHALS